MAVHAPLVANGGVPMSGNPCRSDRAGGGRQSRAFATGMPCFSRMWARPERDSRQGGPAAGGSRLPSAGAAPGAASEPPPVATEVGGGRVDGAGRQQPASGGLAADSSTRR